MFADAQSRIIGARLVATRRETQVGSDGSRLSESTWILDCRCVSESYLHSDSVDLKQHAGLGKLLLTQLLYRLIVLLDLCFDAFKFVEDWLES